MNRSLPLPLVAVAAVVAISFWSLKPIFIALIGERTGFAEVFLIAGGISTVVSLIIATAMWRTTYRLITAQGFARGLAQALLSGVFLGVWYYSFYRALFGAEKVDATVIAFSWPLIAVVAMRFFAPEHAKKLSMSQWALVITAYIGAIAVGISGISRAGTLQGQELMFAFAAALGSGLYLPFSINGIAHFGKILGNKIIATFYVVSFSNGAALALVSLVLWGSDQPLLFYAVDFWVILICALIGIGTYLLAEITWTWAFSEYKSLTLSSLVYLSPAFSVILLFAFFDEPIAAISAFGLVLILFSNMTLHGSYQSTNALVMAMIGTLYVALVSLFIAPVEVAGLTDMLYFMSGLFAILAGFILSRVSSRRAQEIDQRTAMVRGLLDAVPSPESTEADHADAVLRGIIDIEFTPNLVEKDETAGTIRRLLRESDLSASVRQQQLLLFDTWLNIHRDRLSVAERAALWLTGGVSILLMLVVRGNDPLSTVGLYAFSAGCLLVIFAIGDYERNSFQGFRFQMLRLQNGFSEIGHSFYLPKTLIDSNESLALFDDAKVRYCDKDGKVCEQVVVRTNGAFRMMYSAVSVLLIGALLTLPIFMANESQDETVLSLRPELFTDSSWTIGGGETADLTVGVFDWSASQVIGEVIKQTLEAEFEITVALESTAVDEIFEMLADGGGAIDVHTDFWVGNQPDNLRKYVETDQSVKLNAVPYPGRQGVYLPAKNAERLGIADLADLVSADVAKAFDTDGDGLGEIWIGAASWRSTQAMRDLLALYGLTDLWEAQVFSDTILKAKLRQFHSSGRPIVFYGYEPDWIHAAYDLRALTIAPLEGNCPNVLGLVQVGTGCAFEQVDVHIGYASRLEARLPDTAKMLRHLRFRTEDINRWLALLAEGEMSQAEVAATWLRDNANVVESWRAGQSD